MPTDRPLPAAHNPRSPFSLVVAFVGLAGIVALFLPFTWNTTPLATVDTLPFLSHGRDSLSFFGLWRLGVPLVLAVLVTLGSVRWVVSGQFSRTERRVAYLAAFVAACCLLSLYFVYGSGDAQEAPSGFVEWFMVVFSWVGSAAGAYLLWRNARTGVPGAANAIGAMQIVYVVAAVTCLVAFADSGWQLGAYLVALTTLVYLAQIIAVSVAAPGRRAVALK